MEDLRQAARYIVEKVYNGRVSIEVHGSEKLRGSVVDLSISGLSFELDLDRGDSPEGVTDGDFFISLYIDEFNLLLGVERIWSIIQNAGNRRIYKAGLRFKIVADEDRLMINRTIEQIRKNIQNAAANRQQV